MRRARAFSFYVIVLGPLCFFEKLLKSSSCRSAVILQHSGLSLLILPILLVFLHSLHEDEGKAGEIFIARRVTRQLFWEWQTDQAEAEMYISSGHVSGDAIHLHV